MGKIRLRLHRLVFLNEGNTVVTGPILEEAYFSNHINDYLMDRFGQDGNGGISNALQYVAGKYGGGRYRIYLDQIILDGSQTVYGGEITSIKSYLFELAGPSKDPALTKEPYFSPFTGKWE